MTALDAGERRRAGDRRARSRRERLRAPFVAAATAALGLTTLVAALPFWPVYESAEFVVLALVTVLAGSVVGVAGAVLRLSSPVVLVATVAAWLLLGVPLAVPSGAVQGVLPTGPGLLDLVQGTALGWKQLVTISLPVGSYEALLVPVFVLLLVVSVVATTVALRSRRPELAVLGPVVVHLAGIVLGPRDAFLPVVSSLSLLALSVGWVVWWRLRRRRAAIELLGGPRAARSHGHGRVAVRAVVGSVVTVAVAGAAASTAAALMPPAVDRTVARTVVEKPYDPRDDVSPLTRFRAWQQDPIADDTLFTVSGLPAGQLLRLATLDTYDGVAFTVGSAEVSSESGSFERVPSVVDQSGTRGRESDVSVVVGDWSGVWTPTVGQLRQIDFGGPTAAERRDRFFYDDATGAAVVVGGLQEGDSYRLRSVVPPQPTTEQVAATTPGPARVPEPRSVPDELTEALDGYVSGVDGPGAQLVAAVEGLRTQGYVSHGLEGEPPSLSGHGADRLARLFTEPVMVGDAEQYAAAAALMADQLGFPARVVLGLRTSEEAQSDSTGPVALRGSDVTAWIEVDTAQRGWVALDPNPPVRPVPEDQVQDPSQVSRPESVVQPPPVEPQVRDDQAPPRTAQEEADSSPAWIAVVLLVARITGWSALVAGLLASPFLAVAGLKLRRRRRRRRAPSPAARITGGWQEFHDAVVDHRIDTPASATRGEVAASVGGARPALLARVADRAVFAPGDPPPEEAERVWTTVADLRRSLDEGLTRWERFRAAVSLRSLRGYHGGTRPER